MILHRAIAIDGPAASGKSTLARLLSQRLGLIMVNSGAMYRAVTWKVLQLGLDPNDRAAVVGALRLMEIECGVDGLDSTVMVDGVDPGEELRSEEVNANVSAVAAVPEVRECLVSLQRDYLKLGDVVMEGRDIGSVVFPETPYKIYMDADPGVREARREEVGEVDSVAERDKADSGRETAPLKVAEGAAILDTSGHTIETGVAAALKILSDQGFVIPGQSH
ncbi:(d)CMP kinase [Luteolibacter marinus]|uniref:(d)CMP kinase n=1 Tax=Luteolibacter marinus TaxID=2776705 RepID=UPI001865C7F3|nr:(d)CMP kinase [Luteolibacter marinus]